MFVRILLNPYSIGSLLHTIELYLYFIFYKKIYFKFLWETNSPSTRSTSLTSCHKVYYVLFQIIHWKYLICGWFPNFTLFKDISSQYLHTFYTFYTNSASVFTLFHFVCVVAAELSSLKKSGFLFFFFLKNSLSWKIKWDKGAKRADGEEGGQNVNLIRSSRERKREKEREWKGGRKRPQMNKCNFRGPKQLKMLLITLASHHKIGFLPCHSKCPLQIT